MRYILCLLLLTTPCFAECEIDQSTGDKTCVENGISYVYPSEASLSKRAAAQAILEEKEQIEKDKADIQKNIDQNAIELNNALADGDNTLLTSLREKRLELKQQLQALEQ